MCAKYKEEKHIKYCLGNALFALMEKYPYDEITVNEICYQAHVGRATYYNYVSGKHGKDELLSFKLERDFDQYVAVRRSRNLSHSDDGGDLYNFVYDNRSLFRLLHRNQLSNVLIQLIRYSENNIASSGDQAYLDAYIALGHLGIMQQWYEDDYDRSAYDVASIIFQKYSDLVKYYIQKYVEETQKQSN